MRRLTEATGIGRGALLATLLVGIAALVFGGFQRFDTWTTSMFAVVNWHRSAVLLAAIGGAGIAAYSAAVLRRGTLGTLAEIGGRESTVVLRVGLGVGGVLAAVSLIGLVVDVLIARSTDLRGAIPLALVPSTVALLITLPIVGAAAGWATRSVLAAPLVLPLTFFGIDLLSGATSMLLEFSSVTDGVGIWPSLSFSVLQPLALLGVAGVAIALISSRPVAVRYALAGGLAAAVIGLGQAAPEAVRSARVDVVCGGTAVRVCGSADRRLRIAAVSKQLDALEAPLRPLLPADVTFPIEYREGLIRSTSARSTLTVLDARRVGDLIYDVHGALTRCNDPDEDLDDATFNAELLVRGWIATRGRTVDPPPGFEGDTDGLPRDRAKAAVKVSAAARRLNPTPCAS